jgi:hypothetical protein
MLRWTLDEDNDLTLSAFGIFHVTYYKYDDAPLIRWGHKNFRPAPRSVWYSIQSRKER